MITIIDYKMGNIGSIVNMIQKIGYPSFVTSKKEEVKFATRIILPGVGHFDKAMKNLKELDLIEILNKKALIEKVPILGICLGMQLLSERSEEGVSSGLGWIRGEVRRFFFDENHNKLKVPHMGWNTILKHKDSKLLENIDSNSRFYFVHSFHFYCYDPSDLLCTSEYGYNFVSAVSHENIMGVQFHPEKSHRFGMILLKNFIENF